MCSPFTPDCGYDNSTIILIGDVYCSDIKCLVKFCLHKMTFQSLGRSDYQGPQCGSVCQVRNIPFEDQTNSFFLSPGQGVYIFEESPNQFMMLLKMCIVLGSIVPSERNAKVLVVMTQLRDPFILVESGKPGCLFTKFLLCYKST